MLKCAIAASIGAATGALLLLALITWPDAWFTPGTARLAVSLGVVATFGAVLCRRQDTRHREVVRLLTYRQIGDDAESYLRGRDGLG